MQQIDRIEAFCTKTGMRVTFGKTKIVVFRNGGFLRNNENWDCNGHQLRLSQDISIWVYYLPQSSFGLRQKRTCNTSETRFIYNVQNKLGIFSATEAFKFSETMITPILTYTAEMWGYEFSPQIETRGP